MQKYFDIVKEFCLKYKRYFGAAVLFIILIVVLAVYAGPAEQDPVSQDTQNAGTEIDQPEPSEVQLEGTLQHNANEEIVSLINNYYTAYASADVASLEMLATPLTENEKGYINAFSAYSESYQNIECYSMQVSGADAYFVSVCYDLKFKEVDTLAPGMDFFYVERDGRGAFIINNVYSSYNFSFMEQEFDSSIYNMILAYEQMDEVTALQQDVQARYDEAVASDEKLADMVGNTLRNAITQWRASVIAQDTQSTEGTTEPDTQPTEDNSEQQDSQTEEPEDNNETPDDANEEGNSGNNANATYTVTTKDVCNIRASASTDSDLIGQIGAGATLTATGTEGNWTKIQYSGGEGYIRSDLLETN